MTVQLSSNYRFFNLSLKVTPPPPHYVCYKWIRPSRYLMYITFFSLTILSPILRVCVTCWQCLTSDLSASPSSELFRQHQCLAVTPGSIIANTWISPIIRSVPQTELMSMASVIGVFIPRTEQATFWGLSGPGHPIINIIQTCLITIAAQMLHFPSLLSR